MSATTSIEWTDRSWNPARGCALVSPGCTNCYAMKFAHRFSGEGKPYDGLTRLTKHGPVWTGEALFIPWALKDPIGWKKPQRIFVNSMSDLFQESLTNEQIAAVFGVMASTERHTFQVLTKRPARMLEWFRWVNRRDQPAGELHNGLGLALQHHDNWDPDDAIGKELLDNVNYAWPLPNVWLGVSVEDQQRADERIPLLQETPAAVRWVSAEPLLGPVQLPMRGLDWVVVGGESGPGARAFDLTWCLSLVRQCRAAGVPVFVKQLGASPVAVPRDAAGYERTGAGGDVWPVKPVRLSDRKGGDMSEWPAGLRVREYPAPVRREDEMAKTWEEILP